MEGIRTDSESSPTPELIEFGRTARDFAGKIVFGMGFLLMTAGFVGTIGCGPSFRYVRYEAVRALNEGDHVIARERFEQAYRMKPGDTQTLYDLGNVHLYLARDRAETGNGPAAMRELDRSINYYSRAVEAHPGFVDALRAKNHALELKGQYDDALDTAVWATAFVGPRATEQMFLARELEERGDYDGALLRFRQAVAMERDNARAHAEFARFLHRHNRREMTIRHLRIAYKLNPFEPGVADLLTDLHQPLPRTTEPREP